MISDAYFVGFFQQFTLNLYVCRYFAEWDTEVAQQVLTDSLHPKYR